MVTPLSDALQVVKVALEQFGSDSARSEYCRWHGVSYRRTLRYSSTVKILERSFSSLPGEYRRLEGGAEDLRLLPRPEYMYSSPPEETITGSPVINFYTNDGVHYHTIVRIDGLPDEEFDAMVARGVCPLCGHHSHALADCPFLPDEIRPFC